MQLQQVYLEDIEDIHTDSIREIEKMITDSSSSKISGFNSIEIGSCSSQVVKNRLKTTLTLNLSKTLSQEDTHQVCLKTQSL